MPHVPFYFLGHHTRQLFIHSRVEIEVGKILAVVAHFHTFGDSRSFSSAIGERFEERRFAYPIGTFQQQVLILAQRERLFLDYCFVILDGLERGDVEKLAGEIGRARDVERLDGLVLATHFHLRLLGLGGGFAHALGNGAQLPAFHGEEICLLFLGDDYLLHLRIFHRFLLHARGYLGNDVRVIADVLLHLV